jgi:hypothetical protein
MGGLGSGRRGGRNCTDDMRALDVREVSRAGLLTAGDVFSWNWNRGRETTGSVQFKVEAERVIFNYRWRAPAYNGGAFENYPVWLDWTPCALGGRRVWWVCPAKGCSRRVAVLYAGSVFACRHCWKLAYRSQSEAGLDRAARLADAIRERLGWEPGFLNGHGDRPKGMHWATFAKLRAKHDACASASLADFFERYAVRPN